MMNLRSTLLLAGAAAASALTMASPAVAVPNEFGGTTIYGGGASLPAPYFRQAADCWGEKLPLAFRGGALLSPPDFNYVGTPPFNCAAPPVGRTVSPNNAVSYISTGSGRGILAFYAKTALAPVDWLGAPPAPAVYATKVNYALSETALGIDRVGPDGVGVYNVGGSVTESGVTVTVRDPANTNGGTFPNPRSSYGRAIQVPILIAPVVLSFDPIYKKTGTAGDPIEYRYGYGGKRTDGSGGLRISREAMCRIYNGNAVPESDGRIDNWNEIPASNSPPGVQRGEPGFIQAVTRQTNPIVDPEVVLDVPLQIVGRSDGSGTTSIFTRHLAAVCDAVVTEPVNQYDNSTSTLPASLRGPIYNKANDNFPPVAGETPGLFTLADGNDGVAKYLDFTAVPANGVSLKQGRIGYNGSDYVLPYVLVTLQNLFGLNSANVQNRGGAYIVPTPQSAINSFAATPALADPANPAARDDGFVQRSDETSPLADPAINSGYPIVGTTNGLFYQCYADANEAAVTRNFLNWYFSSPTVNDRNLGILAQAGFAPVPPRLRTPIVDNFLLNASGLNLDIRAVTSVAQCGGVSPGA